METMETVSPPESTEKMKNLPTLWRKKTRKSWSRYFPSELPWLNSLACLGTFKNVSLFLRSIQISEKSRRFTNGKKRFLFVYADKMIKYLLIKCYWTNYWNSPLNEEVIWACLKYQAIYQGEVSKQISKCSSC